MDVGPGGLYGLRAGALGGGYLDPPVVVQADGLVFGTFPRNPKIMIQR